jgi:peptidoglycan/LPS O-acetylase OafA/YrhL
MGAASFSIYLLHDSILKIMEGASFLFKGMPLANAAVLCVLSLAPPVAFHYLVEKKLNIWSKKKMLDRLASFEARCIKTKP